MLKTEDLFSSHAAPGKAQVQREIADDEGPQLAPGCSAWIALGLKLEEQQYVTFVVPEGGVLNEFVIGLIC